MIKLLQTLRIAIKYWWADVKNYETSLDVFRSESTEQLTWMLGMYITWTVKYPHKQPDYFVQQFFGDLSLELVRRDINLGLIE